MKGGDKSLARLGYLVGLGWDAGRVAADLGATAGTVHRLVRDLGLSFRETEVAATPLNLDGARMAYFDAAARERRLPTEALLRKVCEWVADERALAIFLDAAPDARGGS